jgi:Tol biopolymer transport system component
MRPIVPDQDWSRGQASFRRIDVSNGQESLLLQKCVDDIHPLVRVSRDGSTLYFTLRERVAEFGWRLRLIKRDLASGDETELYASQAPGFGLFGLALSPDGRTLAFTEDLGIGERKLMTVPVSGGAPRELYRGSRSSALHLGMWTRDGRYVLGAGADSEHQQRVWAFPVVGGDPRKLDLTMQEFGSGDVSPDGRHLVVAGIGVKNELWTIKNLLLGTPGAAASK